MSGRYQLVWWWPEWNGVGFFRFTGSWKMIYIWSLQLGYLEVRRWAK
jgi:hypothetical protein